MLGSQSSEQRPAAEHLGGGDREKVQVTTTSSVGDADQGAWYFPRVLTSSVKFGLVWWWCVSSCVCVCVYQAVVATERIAADESSSLKPQHASYNGETKEALSHRCKSLGLGLGATEGSRDAICPADADAWLLGQAFLFVGGQAVKQAISLDLP